MSLVDFIAFIITMILMFFIILRRAWQESRQKPQEKQEQEANLKKFLKELNLDMEEEEEEEYEEEEEEPEPPPKPIIIHKPHIPPPPMQHRIPKVAENYHALVKERPSKARRLINQLPSRKEMIIYQEIMNPPVSMR